jgi:hypothetical protein
VRSGKVRLLSAKIHLGLSRLLGLRLCRTLLVPLYHVQLMSNIGIGVGNSSASPTGAVLITVTRECFGRLATISFAHAMGTSIEAECKAHRLISDVFCDVAMVLDFLSLSLPTTFRFPVLCLSSTLFAASGVAGRSSKSSLSAHFAKWNNIGELNAVSQDPQLVVWAELMSSRQNPVKKLR